jgi:ferredoxin
VPKESICKLCGDCWRYCPAEAIFLENKKLRFDYDKCIRCYCCLEVCPHGALKAEEPPLGKLFNRFINITS